MKLQKSAATSKQIEINRSITRFMNSGRKCLPKRHWISSVENPDLNRCSCILKLLCFEIFKTNITPVGGFWGLLTSEQRPYEKPFFLLMNFGEELINNRTGRLYLALAMLCQLSHITHMWIYSFFLIKSFGHPHIVLFPITFIYIFT